MEKIILLAMPLFAVAAIIIPLAVSIIRKKQGKKANIKKSIIANAASFVGCLALMIIAVPNLVGAEAAAEAATEAAGGIAEGMKYLGAALSTGLATIGTGIAVGGAAPAAIGATSEDEKNFTKSLIFVALGEGVAIYGILISILILFS